jgi:outer membrane protein OmpA-like peptidoglycan-associated protein
MRSQRSALRIVVSGAACLALAASMGCAKKKYVDENLSAQDRRIADIETEVESTQRQIRETGQRVEYVAGDARDAASRADEAITLAKGKLVYEVVLSERAGHFNLEEAKLSPEAHQVLDEVAERMKSVGGTAWLEVEGHTDSSGSETYNMGLGLARAEAARQYLSSKHGIPLHKMAVTSYGETKPVGDNATQDGRSKNRRIEVRLLS